eukprot:Gb_35699 [translate_table: standard]
MESQATDVESHVDSDHLLLDTPSSSSIWFEQKLNEEVGRLGIALAVLGLDQSTRPTLITSWLVFSVLGIVVPLVSVWVDACTECTKIEVRKFEKLVQISESALTAVSLLCFAHNFRKYGLRRFLFLDQIDEEMLLQQSYQKQIHGAFRLLKWILFPCLVVKTIHEALRVIYFHEEPWWEHVIFFAAIMVSWLYRTTVFFSACVLFNLACNIQILHFEDYTRLLEETSDVSLFLKEHMRLRHQLYKISHRYRLFIVLALLVVTASQFLALFETTAYSGRINFLNAGNLAVCAAVELLGVVLCLRAAARMTHRGQSIASIASKWHALATCNLSSVSSDGQSSTVNVDQPHPMLSAEYDSDLEPSEDLNLPSASQLAPYMTSYHKRQALVMYFQFNQAGITIFGFMVDRALIHTIFFVEFSLVLWILGKTVGIS